MDANSLHDELEIGINQLEDGSLVDFEDLEKSLSVEDWNAVQETQYLLSIPGMRESMIDGMNEPLSRSTR